MKQLPTYLDKVLDHMAESEASHGNVQKDAAKALFKKELINESLTAKANPAPGRAKIKQSENPTVKPFHEIYDIAGKDFRDSPLGKSLGGFNGLEKTGGEKGEGRKFFEDLRNFCTNTADAVIKAVFHKQLKRFNPGSKTPAGSFLENASGEYPLHGLKGMTLTERTEVQRQTEEMRYYKLLISSLIFGLVEPIFKIRKEELEGLLYEVSPKPKKFTPEELQKDPSAPRKEFEKILQQVATPAYRKKFIMQILGLLRDRDGIVTASIKASEYIGKESVAGGKIYSDVVTQLAELEKIKTTAGSVTVVRPELMIPR